MTNSLRVPAPSRADLRNFGIVACAILIAVSAYQLYSGATDTALIVATCGLLFLLTGLLAPEALRPIYYIWMTLGLILGWINLRIIMGLILLLIFTPVRLIQLIIGRDVLHRKLDSNKDSYFVRPKSRPPNHFEHMS
ncbi:MAG: hypothetical protein IIB00_03735 [candidate division Zixibacteria bacterium]|nr:hypothetical protein [candidate division Zixibacteria bacterium]